MIRTKLIKRIAICICILAGATCVAISDTSVDIEPTILPKANFSVSGIVLDTEGKPLVGAKIIARCFDPRVTQRTTTTDSAGKVTVGNIPGGPIIILADFKSRRGKSLRGNVRTAAGKQDFKIIVRGSDTPTQPQKSAEIPIPQEAQTDGLIITGIVRDKAGNPVEGAELTVLAFGASADAVGGYSSDSEGKFYMNYSMFPLPMIPLGVRFPLDRMYLMARDPSSNQAATIPINRNTKKMDITLSKGAILTGRVVGPDNQPIPGAEILLRLSSGRWADIVPLHDLKTSKEGRYEIKAVPYEHRYVITAKAHGFYSDDVRIDLRNVSSEVVEQSTLILKPVPEDQVIRGRIVSERGVPIFGATVIIDDSEQPQQKTKTDRSGSFVFNRVAQGRTTIAVFIPQQ